LKSGKILFRAFKASCRINTNNENPFGTQDLNMHWLIEHFNKARHTRTGFDCGKPPLTGFLHNFMTQYEKKNFGRTYVAVRSGETQMLGYYTLATSELSLEDLSESEAKKLPHHPVPVVLLARLAADQTVHGQGLGKALLNDALRRVLQVSEHVGIHAVVVDAIDDEAAKFYQKYGFTALPDQPHKLLLPLSSIPGDTHD